MMRSGCRVIAMRTVVVLLLLDAVGQSVAQAPRGNPAQSSERKYFPSKTGVVYSLNVEQVMQTDLFKQFRKGFTLGDQKRDPFDEKVAEKQFGVPFSNIERITLALSTVEPDDEVIIIHTRQPAKAMSILRAKPDPVKFEEIRVDAFTVYKASEEYYPSFCVAEDKVIVISSFKALQNILKRGKDSELPASMNTALANADFSRTLVFAFNAREIRLETEKDKKKGPSPLTELARGLAALKSKDNPRDKAEELDQLFASVELLSGSIDVTSEVVCKVTAVCKEPASAEAIKNVLTEGLVQARNLLKEERKNVKNEGQAAAIDLFQELCGVPRFSRTGNALEIEVVVRGDLVTRSMKVAIALLDENAKISRARIDVAVLSKQVKIYLLNNNDFPPNLKALTEKQPNGGPPLAPPDKLLDPWGKPYQLVVDKDREIEVFTISPDGKRISSKKVK